MLNIFNSGQKRKEKKKTGSTPLPICQLGSDFFFSVFVLSFLRITFSIFFLILYISNGVPNTSITVELV